MYKIQRMVKKDAMDGAPHLNPKGRQNITDMNGKESSA